MKSEELKTQNLELEVDSVGLNRDFNIENDVLAEEILENMNSTPLGQVLMKIACMPEVRQKKVLSLRSQICDGSYDENDHIDSVLEKVLGEI